MTPPTASRNFMLIAGLTVLYGIIWFALEGELIWDLLLAAPLLALGMIHAGSRILAGRMLTATRIAALAAVAGAAYGAGLSLLTLFLMAVKTGLHAHGPEYSARDIAWVWAQLPLWAVAGGLVGLGVGLLLAARR